MFEETATTEVQQHHLTASSVACQHIQKHVYGEISNPGFPFAVTLGLHSSCTWRLTPVNGVFNGTQIILITVEYFEGDGEMMVYSGDVTQGASPIYVFAEPQVLGKLKKIAMVTLHAFEKFPCSGVAAISLGKGCSSESISK